MRLSVTRTGQQCVAGLCVVLICLGLEPGALVQAGNRSETQGHNGVSELQPGANALSAGRWAKGEGDLAQAETAFHEALADAERGGDIFHAAFEELTYHLPLMRVERHVVAERWSEAERLLQDLLEQHQSDGEKSRHLVHLIAQLRDGTPSEGGVYTQEGGGRGAMRHVVQVLERFLDEKGRYPRDYQELNAVLPADRYPLNEFDIVHYIARGRAYGLTLRGKTDPHIYYPCRKPGW
ncbi:MAG: hypothetical protein MAG794_00320 [Gammaproteobacteria bacterium]|nr:hypothetical protein [Gammaproteobacteria bacterium]